MAGRGRQDQSAATDAGAPPHDPRSRERRAYEDDGLGFKAICKKFPDCGETPDQMKARAHAEGWRYKKGPPVAAVAPAPEPEPAPANERRRNPPMVFVPVVPRKPGPPLGGGRIELDPEEIRAFKGKALTMRHLAYLLGVSSDTLVRRRNENEEVAEAVQFVLERTIVVADDEMLKAVKRGDTSMIRFVQERLGGLAATTKHEVSGSNGGPVAVSAILSGVLAELVGQKAPDVPAETGGD